MKLISRFKVNKGSVREKVFAPNARNKAFAYEKLTEKIEDVKKKFMDEFETHPITKEIEAGNDAKNISKTLIGRGNLFTFIGFNLGDQPITELREALDGSFKVKKKLISFRKHGRHQFVISVPTLKELEKITPMPWDKTRSWLRGIESGISGLSKYMYEKNGYFDKSRSEKGLQAKGPIKDRGGVKFVNSRYMSRMLRSVYRRLGIWE